MKQDEPKKNHAVSIDGWTPGDLDFYVVPPQKYTAEDDDVWRTLYRRQKEILKGRAMSSFMDSLSTLGIREDKVPDLDEVNAILEKRTGWKLVTVPGMIPEMPFFDLIANRRFPIGNFLRTRAQIDYIQEPDIFHDLFGHAPILVDPIFADYIHAFGKGGKKAAALGAGMKLARLYWYTVEFGLIQEKEGLRIFGAGILSSPTESVFALEDPSPHRIKFDVKRILRTPYRIDDFQENYFVIDSFQQLFDETAPDFTPIYAELKGQPKFEPGQLQPGDKIVTHGTGDYFKDKQPGKTKY